MDGKKILRNSVVSFGSVFVSLLWVISAGAQSQPLQILPVSSAVADARPLLPSAPPPRLFLTPITVTPPEPEHSPTVKLRAYLPLSAAVYGVAFLDMQRTMSVGPSMDEHDPLARPLTKLPVPAYYATGAALATAVNLVAWKMAHSRRWHKVWWLPQTATLAGNTFGYSYTSTH